MLQEAAIDVQMAIYDLSIAAQNRMLGDLFAYRVPLRRPGDPSVEVLRLPENL